MHKGKRGVLFVFSGPSGVGKGTLKAKSNRVFRFCNDARAARRRGGRKGLLFHLQAGV